MEGVGLNESDTPELLKAYLVRNPELSRVARLADASGKATGALIGAVLCGHDGRRGYLHHLAVERAFRRQGIGRALVTDCLRALGRLEITRCNIFVYADNADGQAFWLANGWLHRRELCLLQRQTLPLDGDSTRLEGAC
jgi:putative acetyltransferase